jgi:hypothetical protein
VIERAGVDDVAVRVVAANQRPDHCTIARFRQRHEAALGGLFGDVLALCAEAGLVGVAVLAVDGTKLHANASQHQNLDYDQVAKEILAEADAVDRSEDERFGDRRGDELPAELATVQGRRGRLRDAKRRLDERRAAEARSRLLLRLAVRRLCDRQGLSSPAGSSASARSAWSCWRVPESGKLAVLPTGGFIGPLTRPSGASRSGTSRPRRARRS